MEKVGQGQKLCDCVKVNLLGLPRGGKDKWEEGL